MEKQLFSDVAPEKRANLTYKKTQFVKSNIQESFILVLPVIKGQKNEEIELIKQLNSDLTIIEI